MDKNGKNLYCHRHSVTAEDPWESNWYKSALWFTGLSAYGKSISANALYK